MNKILALAFSLLLILSCSACGYQNDPAQQVSFYYCAKDPADTGHSTHISPELWEDIRQNSLEEIIDLYLSGPRTEDLRSPFPEGLQIVLAEQQDSTMYLTVSPHLCQLTDMELTVACACLTLTIIELRQVQQVVITPEEGLLDGQKSITMDKNALLLQITSLEGE